jgi:hypothetical protein
MRDQTVRFLRRCGLAVATLALSCIVCRTVEAADSSLTAADQKAIAWFDALGFPEFTQKPCVRMVTGYSQKAGEQSKPHYRIGFLFEDETRNDVQGESTVFMLDLSTQSLQKKKPGAPKYHRMGYDIVDLKGVAESRIAELRKPPAESDHWGLFGGHLSERGEVFVLARACAAKGLDGPAHDLIVEATKMCGIHSLVATLSDDIAESCIWEAVVAFSDPSVSRKELLKRFRFIVKNFPESACAAQARETADLLGQMIDEDEKHDRRVVKPLSEMASQDRVAELIFQLRDQNGHQCGQPGWCDIFDKWLDGEKKSPAHQLAAMGFDAVPQLIAALNDRRFTRSVGYCRNFFFSHHVLRVGDCAEAVLCRIAGRGFSEFAAPSLVMRKADEAEATRKEIELWWAAVQKKGEKQVLIEGIAMGKWNSVFQARRLVDHYPEDAIAPIVAAIKSSNDDGIRQGLVEVICGISGDASVQTLVEEMNASPVPEASVAAARELLRRGRKETIPAMIALWNRMNTKDSRGTSPAERMADDHIKPLTAFLANCGDAAAVEALAKHLDKQSVSLRLDIVRAFGSPQPNEGMPEPPKLVEETIERVLIAALDDTAKRGWPDSSIGDAFVSDLRICDMAAHVLAERFPKKYTFEYSSAERDRDRQRLTMLNRWRKEQHLPPVSLPKRTSDAK